MARVQVVCRDTQPGDEVCVTGADAALGAWNPRAGLRLQTSGETFPAWSAPAPRLSPGSEFKFCVVGGGGERWEPLEGNRRWPGEASEGCVVCATFGEAGERVERLAAASGRAEGARSAVEKPVTEAPKVDQRRRRTEGMIPKQGFHRAVSLRERLITTNQGNISDFYDIDERKLGEGAFGAVCKATCKRTKTVFAVKTVVKKQIQNVPDFEREIDLMKQLDHPHIVRLVESFQDHRCIYLVMELCEGGDLFDRICDRGHLTEPQAAVLMEQVFMALCYMHEKRVAHRDIKAENFLFVSKQEVDKTPLKMTDFGLSSPFDASEGMKTMVGTATYVAPEVMSGQYTEACDVWSCGVLLYCLLSGRVPFGGRTDAQILQNVRNGRYSFEATCWNSVSEGAKDLVRRILVMDPSQRPTAEEALEDEWIKSRAAKSSGSPLSSDLVVSLQASRAQNRLQQAAVTVIAGQLQEFDLEKLRETFKALDSNGNGVLTLVEMKEGLEKSGIEVPKDLKQILEQMDTDCDGEIAYTEFLAGAMDARLMAHEDLCWAAFKAFDRNGDGTISAEELKLVLEDDAIRKTHKACDAEALLKDLDTNQDGNISFDEFVAMMRQAKGQ